MKKAMMVLMAMTMFTVAANAEVMDFHATVRLSGDNVQISFPTGTSGVLEVIKYDDVNQIPPRSIGATETFSLKQGEGFNFKISERWNLVTPDTPVGDGLAIACSPDGCKYVRPK
jgi:hypothetical protein